MKYFWFRPVLCVAFMLALCVGLFGARQAEAASTKKRKKQPKPVTVTGVVQAERKDKNGEVVLVSINADKKKYLVAPTAKGKELVGLEGKTVKATGRIRITRSNTKVIYVNEYELVEPKKTKEKEEV